jgi:short-subunit dehydrogenase
LCYLSGKKENKKYNLVKNKNFEGKVAIITGSSMGIGKATAYLLAQNGVSIVLNGRNAEKLEKTKAEMLARNYKVIAFQGDVTLAADCERLIKTTLDTYGKIDILINNAGVSMRGNFETLDASVFEKVYNTNILGAVILTKYALPHIKSSKGSIVFISSVAAIRGLPGVSVYCSAKMALTAIAESLKVELSGTGMHIGIVHVGFTQNEADKKTINAEGELIPIEERSAKKAQTTDEVAKAIFKNIRKRHFKTVISFLGKMNVFTNKLFPRLADKILVKSMKSSMYK